MTPSPRLKDYKVGDTVILKGWPLEKGVSLYIGKINENGYYFLWRSQSHFENGKPWAHAASSYHLVEP